MQTKIAGVVRSLTPGWIGRGIDRLARLLDPDARRSYSQEGEDLVTSRFLEGRREGFYVDIGAHHPTRFSNTQLFYKEGWKGINIEPSPDATKRFQKMRRRDTYVAMGVGEAEGELTYYVFNDPALNTFDEKLMREREAETGYWVVGTKKIAVDRLERILGKHIPIGQEIDFMSVDVEGFDLQVLRSNDWNRYRPELVLVEALDFKFSKSDEHPIHIFMSSVDYELVAKTQNTLFFRELK